MTLSIAIVCEARADRDSIISLADRLILHHFGDSRSGWIAEEHLDEFRSYRGATPEEEFFAWKNINSRGRVPLRPILGQFTGYLPSHEDELNVLRVLQYLMFHCDRSPDGIILLRDTDDEPGRKKGLERVRREMKAPFVIGFAHTKRECWHIAGFEPDPESEAMRVVEQVRLDDLCRGDNLGFDPRWKSHELTALGDHDKRSAKRVLSFLTDKNPEREARCLRSLSLDELSSRGQNNGLANFLADLESRLLPLFGPMQRQ